LLDNPVQEHIQERDSAKDLLQSKRAESKTVADYIGKTLLDKGNGGHGGFKLD